MSTITIAMSTICHLHFHCAVYISRVQTKEVQNIRLVTPALRAIIYAEFKFDPVSPHS